MHEKDESLPEQDTTTPTTDDDGSYVNMDAQQFDDNPVMQSVLWLCSGSYCGTGCCCCISDY